MIGIKKGLLIGSALALSLSGCVGGLLGGGKPDAMYRFGAGTAVEPPAGSGMRQRSLSLPPPIFAPEIAGDRILTTDGLNAAYLKDSRWISSTPSLFEAALVEAFAAKTTNIAIARRRTPADHALRVVITRFEARYRAGEASAPVASVAGEATLMDLRTNRPLATHRFLADVPATEDRIAAIVAALDVAAARAISDTVSWTDTVLQTRPADCRPASGTAGCP